MDEIEKIKEIISDYADEYELTCLSPSEAVKSIIQRHLVKIYSLKEECDKDKEQAAYWGRVAARQSEKIKILERVKHAWDDKISKFYKIANKLNKISQDLDEDLRLIQTIEKDVENV